MIFCGTRLLSQYYRLKALSVSTAAVPLASAYAHVRFAHGAAYVGNQLTLRLGRTVTHDAMIATVEGEEGNAVTLQPTCTVTTHLLSHAPVEALESRLEHRESNSSTLFKVPPLRTSAAGPGDRGQQAGGQSHILTCKTKKTKCR